MKEAKARNRCRKRGLNLSYRNEKKQGGIKPHKLSTGEKIVLRRLMSVSNKRLMFSPELQTLMKLPGVHCFYLLSNECVSMLTIPNTCEVFLWNLAARMLSSMHHHLFKAMQMKLAILHERFQDSE
jgi:hypothetical protein